MAKKTKSFVQVLSPGFYSSVQDGGRRGYMHLGVPHSGFMDGPLAALANEMLGNREQDSCIEFFKSGLSLRFSRRTNISIAGIDVAFRIDDKVFNGSQNVNLQDGSKLKILSLPKHNWGYLAVQEGFQSDIVLGSRSMMKGLTFKDRLFEKMAIPYFHQEASYQDIAVDLVIEKKQQIILKIGPEWELLPEGIKSRLFQKPMVISPQSNRQACVLEGESFPFAGAEINSGYTPIGTVQLTPSGKLFVLMNDGQTTGGYFRIGFVEKEDLALLAQKPFGEEIHFTIQA